MRHLSVIKYKLFLQIWSKFSDNLGQNYLKHLRVFLFNEIIFGEKKFTWFVHVLFTASHPPFNVRSFSVS